MGYYKLPQGRVKQLPRKNGNILEKVFLRGTPSAILLAFLPVTGIMAY
jgi:hypothetical protein